MTSLKHVIAAAGRAAGIDIIRISSLRHPSGRRSRLGDTLEIDLIIDVGANQGQFGIEMRRTGYQGAIVSIEPLEVPYSRLRARANRDRDWTVIRSAVGSQAGSADIGVAGNAGASSSFLPMLDQHVRAAPAARYVGKETVPIATLDELVEVHLAERASIFTKLDVQGFELEALAGARTTLSRSALVQLELSLVPTYEGGPSYREVIDFMRSRGFHLVGCEPGLASPSGVLVQADGLFASDMALRRLGAEPFADQRAVHSPVVG